MENKSKFLNLNAIDILKGFIVAVTMALLTGVYQIISSNGDVFNWLTIKPILISSLGAGIAYLIKNAFTNSNDTFLQKEQ